jgi:hypothetical protein
VKTTATYKVDSYNDGRFITIRTHIMDEITTRVIDTEDALIIRELQRMGWHKDTIHLNTAGDLPPVACPLVIEVPGCGMLRAERTGFVANKGNEMEYRLSDGTTLTGRFRWTYP